MGERGGHREDEGEERGRGKRGRESARARVKREGEAREGDRARARRRRGGRVCKFRGGRMPRTPPHDCASAAANSGSFFSSALWNRKFSRSSTLPDAGTAAAIDGPTQSPTVATGAPRWLERLSATGLSDNCQVGRASSVRAAASGRGPAGARRARRRRRVRRCAPCPTPLRAPSSGGRGGCTRRHVRRPR